MRVVVPARGDIPYGVRLALLFVLALSTVVVHLNQAPPLRPASELISDLRAGGVTKVVYDRNWPAYGTLTWSHGPLSWSQARFDQPDDVWDPETTRLVPEALERSQGAFLAQVRAAADPGVEIVRTEGFGGLVGSSAYGRWWEPFGPVAVAAEVLAWLFMLTRPNPATPAAGHGSGCSSPVVRCSTSCWSPVPCGADRTRCCPHRPESTAREGSRSRWRFFSAWRWSTPDHWVQGPLIWREIGPETLLAGPAA